MELIKCCHSCVHFHLYLGEPDWSAETPGNPGSVSCHKGHFEQDAYTVCFAVTTKILDSPNCPDWEQNEELAKQIEAKG